MSFILNRIIFLLVSIFFCETVFAKNICILYKKNSSAHDSFIYSFFNFAESQKYHCIKLGLDSTQNITDIMHKIRDEENIDLILAIGDYSAKVAIQTNLPGVFINVINPVKAGLIDSEGNLKTKLFGISMDIPIELKLPIIRSICPKVKNILLVYNELDSKYIVNQYKNFLKEKDIKLHAIPISDESELVTALDENKSVIDCIMAIVDNSVYNLANTALTLRFSAFNNIPLFAFSSQIVSSGALLGFYVKPEALAEQAFSLMKTGNVESKIVFPSDFNFSVNAGIKKIFNADISDEILYKADKVVRK